MPKSKASGVLVVARGEAAEWESREALREYIRAQHEPQRDDEMTSDDYAILADMHPRSASTLLSHAAMTGELVDGCKIDRRKVGRGYLYRFTRA